MTFAWWHVLVALLPVLPAFLCIWHIWTHSFGGDFQKKVLWLVLVVFLPVVGWLLYALVGRKKAGTRF